MAGTLERPVALAPSASEDLREGLPGSWQYAGTHWLLVPAGTSPTDTASLRAALQHINPTAWRGPSTSEQDRSPVRRAASRSLPIMPLLAALHLGCALQESGDVSTALDVAEWMRDFVRTTEANYEWVDSVLQATADGFPVGSRWCR